MTSPTLDEILEALSLASVGDLGVRVRVDEGDLEDELSLIANAVNLLLDDLEYRQQERESALEIAAAARAKEEFLAQLSHDMQTPLAVLLGYLDLIDTDSGEIAGEALPPMRHAARTLHRYVRQFLDYARLEAGQPLAVVHEPVDLSEVVGEVVPMFASGTPLEVEVRDPRPVADADRERTSRIVANLISNAFSHGLPEVVRVEIAGDDETVTVEVVDDGVGMTAAEVVRAFGKFERGPSSAAGGTGLGLYVSRALAEAQGGALTAVSAPGEGSRFMLRLPRHG